MKDIILLLFISLFYQITSKCQTGLNSTYEECFAREITEEEISSGENVNDYTCCYLKQMPSQEKGECVLLKNTDIPNYIELLDECRIPHDVFACSEDELPDQSISTSCFLSNPLKKTNCFTRSISDSETGGSENNNYKCCHIAFNNIKECAPVDSSNIEGFKTQFIQAHMKYGYVIHNLEVICGDSIKESNNSNKDSNEGSDYSNEGSEKGSDNSNNDDSNEGIDDSNKGSEKGSDNSNNDDSNEGLDDSNNYSNNSNIDSNNSNKNSCGTFTKIFGIYYFIWKIILFV